MDAEQARDFLLSLPHVVETKQWGDNLVFWVGDKAIGGKMFALVDLGSGPTQGVIAYAAGPERYHELLERDGLYPAPYMARIFWVAAERWSALRHIEWQDELRAAHQLVYDKLPQRVTAIFSLPAKQRAQRIAQGREDYEAKVARAKASKARRAAAKKASTAALKSSAAKRRA